jgi:thymidylate synthase (FAD)
LPLPHATGEQLTADERHLHDESRRIYEARLAAGVAREQARKDLPLATYTEAYWKVDIHNLLHFLALRMDPHAQEEIRLYATAIGQQIVKPLFPVVWEAFEDYRMGGSSLSRLELGAIQRLTARAAEAKAAPPYSIDDFMAAQDPTWHGLTRCRERDECRDKLIDLGLLRRE